MKSGLAGDLALSELELRSQQFLSEDKLYKQSRGLSEKLVSAFIRRQELRGSHVRLDVESLYRPDAYPRGSIDPSTWLWHVGLAYRFKHAEHINVLELRALVGSYEWRLRSSSFSRCRALPLTDSVVALSVAVKGRSSSRTLNKILPRFAVLQCAGGIVPISGWVESEDNPADAPSRRYAPWTENRSPTDERISSKGQEESWKIKTAGNQPTH